MAVVVAHSRAFVWFVFFSLQNQKNKKIEKNVDSAAHPSTNIKQYIQESGATREGLIPTSLALLLPETRRATTSELPRQNRAP